MRSTADLFPLFRWSAAIALIIPRVYTVCLLAYLRCPRDALRSYQAAALAYPFNDTSSKPASTLPGSHCVCPEGKSRQFAKLGARLGRRGGVQLNGEAVRSVHRDRKSGFLVATVEIPEERVREDEIWVHDEADWQDLEEEESCVGIPGVPSPPVCLRGCHLFFQTPAYMEVPVARRYTAFHNKPCRQALLPPKLALVGNGRCPTAPGSLPFHHLVLPTFPSPPSGRRIPHPATLNLWRRRSQAVRPRIRSERVYRFSAVCLHIHHFPCLVRCAKARPSALRLLEPRLWRPALASRLAR